MGKYDDIISLPHPVSNKHPHMSIYDRAAQFAPFSALTGFDDEIEETSKEQKVKTGDLGAGYSREEFIEDC